MNSRMSHPNILVVDDEEMITSLLDDYLSGLGYGVSLAGTAEEAIAKLNNGHDFQLVLADINLPGRSGLELLKIVNETKKDIPVVLLTGMKTLDTAISALQSGARDYITKPFELAKIQKIVSKVLNIQNRHQQKERIYSNLKHLRMNFNFKTHELNPGVLAKELAQVLFRMNVSTEEEINQFELVFTETLINAIEHGNLELKSTSKSNDLLQIAEFDEMREQRLADPQFAGRNITVTFECSPELFSLTIKDEGPGFDWQRFIDKGHKLNETSMDAHGRGFMIIRHIIDEVHFNAAGNMITLIKNF
ncbi:MAG: response regulator [Calditrichia bacterium]